MTRTTKQLFHLWWLNTKTNKRFYAGKAFFNEENSDYALQVNLLETSYEAKRPVELFLRPIRTNEDQTYYRVEKVITRKENRERFYIGEGRKSFETEGDIHISIEPLTNFYKKLVLTIPQVRENEVA